MSRAMILAIGMTLVTFLAFVGAALFLMWGF